MAVTTTRGCGHDNDSTMTTATAVVKLCSYIMSILYSENKHSFTSHLVSLQKDFQTASQTPIQLSKFFEHVPTGYRHNFQWAFPLWPFVPLSPFLKWLKGPKRIL